MARPALVFLCASAILAAAMASTAHAQYRLVIMPKLTGIAYYDAVRRGIEAADAELADVDVSWVGPTQDAVERQIELIDALIPMHPDVIAVAANDAVAIGPALQRVQRAGIHVMSWDGDCSPREFFVNLVDYEEFGQRLVAALVDEVGTAGEVAIVTTSFDAPNQMSWIKAVRRTLYARYPELRIVDIRPAGESSEQAFRVAHDLLQTFPRLKAIVALGAPNLPGAAQAVRAAGMAGKVAVLGNSTPNLTRQLLKDGTLKKVLLWNAEDHGYLTVHAARELLLGRLAAGRPFSAGHLGTQVPKDDKINAQVALPVLTFTAANVDEFNF
jgi:rhamnose transport system substrate-binding protein